MSMFEALSISGSALTAQRMRMDVTSENLANAQTTRTANGEPYRRKEVTLEQIGSPDIASAQGTVQDTSFGEALAGEMEGPRGPAGGVKVTGIVEDTSPDQQIYEPGNPEANAQGYVRMPNVNTVSEMTDLISESRSYESDVTAMQTAKSMFSSTLELLRP